VLLRNRPTWLTLGALRRPFNVSGEACHAHYPCLVEARYAKEGDDAIPADRLLLDLMPLGEVDSQTTLYSTAQSTPSADLYLRPGSYRLKFIAKGDRVVHEENVVVPDASVHH
jgi:hypothetical protein